MMKEKRNTGNQYHLKPKSFEYGPKDIYGERAIWIPRERLVRCRDCGLSWENTKLDKKKKLDFVDIMCPNCRSRRLMHHEGMEE
jgi:DNA-directed RNA polymerase subunit RPC12/RpoP